MSHGIQCYCQSDTHFVHKHISPVNRLCKILQERSFIKRTRISANVHVKFTRFCLSGKHRTRHIQLSPKIRVLWDVTPCKLRSQTTVRLPHSATCKWRKQVSLKRWYISTRIHGVTFWKTSHNHSINPLNPELNPICYLLALLGAQHFSTLAG